MRRGVVTGHKPSHSLNAVEVIQKAAATRFPQHFPMGILLIGGSQAGLVNAVKMQTSHPHFQTAPAAGEDPVL